MWHLACRSTDPPKRALLFVGWDNTYGLQARVGRHGQTHNMTIEEVIRFAASRIGPLPVIHSE